MAIRFTPNADAVKVTFVLPLAACPDRCSVVGDFNDWRPGAHEMRRRSNGTRSATVTLPAGSQIRFRYLAEQGQWFNDPDVPTRQGADTFIDL
ncbi:MAG TPA: isoamylase early set domain-containing protein [Pseudonocardia sp.]